jgi:diguanylate cyclase (GGDEF)-like protein
MLLPEHSVSAIVARTGSPARADGGAPSAVAVPVIVDGAPWGSLCVASARPAPLPAGSEALLTRLAELAALSIMSASARDQMATLAATDHLTGLWNRRAFQERLAAELERARRYDRPLALVMIDIDHFKRINDVHGHPVGDRVLIEVASRLFATVREGEVVARVGGEEFAWILPETDGDGAVAAAERVRAAISAQTFTGVGRLTVSLGVCDLDEGETASELVRLADRALYQAKADGRDRVVRAAPEVVAGATGRTG